MGTKVKSFCTAMETTKKMKRQSSAWEKITASKTDKGLISKKYKQCIKLKIKQNK